MAKENDIKKFLEGLKRLNPNEDEFHQAVEETASSVFNFYKDHQKYVDAMILERLTEPDRVITFRVSWEDDQKNIRVNRGWRVQFNNILGPYKGGLRFHKSVSLSILKFLGFEQCLKNALTGLPMGGAKGGSNFNPKGKSDREIMRFCQAYMQELHHHIGPFKDIPAGDIGVGAREISYLFGHYIKLTNTYQGVITGKDLTFGGSSGRKEATGHGCIYFLLEMLSLKNENLKGKSITISGSGVVAIYAAEKAISHDAKVLTLSDSSGFIHAPSGLSVEMLDEVKRIKEVERGRISDIVKKFPKITFHTEKKPWAIASDIALPCANERDIDFDNAKTLKNNDTKYVVAGANMPLTSKATEYLVANNILVAPDKAANAGGVAVSCFEQTQNLTRVYWSLKKVDENLREIMSKIHQECLNFSTYNSKTPNYIDGANIAGFKKIADALVASGIK